MRTAFATPVHALARTALFTAAVAVIFLMPAALHATTITQTDDVGPTVSESFTTDSTPFSYFNTSLGTLTAVTLTVSGPITFTPPTGPLAGLATFSVVATDKDAIVSKLLDKSTSSNLDLTDTVTDATLLKSFDGTGTFDGSITLSSALGSANGSGLTEMLTYTFTPMVHTPVVPEPSSLVLLGTGALGLIGSVRRRRMAA